MQTFWDRALSAILVLAAVAIAGTVVHRGYFDTSSPPSQEIDRSARFDGNWRDALEGARIVGDPEASVLIVVFSDLECPFCRRFHDLLRVVTAKHGQAVAYAFAHFPLAGHQHAPDAAQAAECAAAGGRFAELLDFVFDNQDSLGVQDWLWFARGAGISDSAAFLQCMEDRAGSHMIDKGIVVGGRMGVRGTPAVFLNGWRYPGVPPEADFLQAVDDLVAGKSPFDGFPAAAVNAQR